MFRALPAVIAFLSLSGPAGAAELVAPATLGQALFDAAPITTTDAKGRHAQIMFAPGGTLTRVMADGRSAQGTWRLSDDGFCMKMDSARREGCYLVLRREDGRFTVVKMSGQGFVWQR